MSDKQIEVGKWAIQYRGCPNCCPIVSIPMLPFIVTEITNSDGGDNCRRCGYLYLDKRLAGGCGPTKYHFVSLMCIKRIDDPPAEESTEEKRELETQ